MGIVLLTTIIGTVICIVIMDVKREASMQTTVQLAQLTKQLLQSKNKSEMQAVDVCNKG